MRIDLHRHVGGSISPTVVFDILQRQKRGSYQDVSEVVRDLTFYEQVDGFTFQNFLRKFNVLDTIVWDEQAIALAIKQVCYDVAREKIEYCELKLTINKYVQHTNWPDGEVIKFIHNLILEQCERWNIYVALVLCLKYESDRHRQKEIAGLIQDPTVAPLVVGLDCVGDEQYYDADFYAPIFKEWKEAGKGLEAHVGESQSAENVRSAIEVLGVDRIAHGIKAAEYPDILKLANDRKVCFDIATTSNFYTGVVDRKHPHPVRKLLEQGCNVTIGTDDPVVLVTDLDHEYTFLQKHLELPDDRLMDIMENSYKYAFTNLDDLRIRINETQ